MYEKNSITFGYSAYYPSGITVRIRMTDDTSANWRYFSCVLIKPWRGLFRRCCEWEDLVLVGGLVAIFYFQIYWESNHPNWRSYFSGGGPTTNQWLRWFSVSQWLEYQFGYALNGCHWEKGDTSRIHGRCLSVFFSGNGPLKLADQLVIPILASKLPAYP